MRVKLNQLQRVVKRAMNEEKTVKILREEVSRVLGPIMDTDVKLGELAEAVNDRVAVLERTGRQSRLTFKPSVLARFARNKNVEVRKMCARLLPERFAAKMAGDPNHRVRAIVASRVPLATVRKMVNHFPGDKEVKRILTLREAHDHAHEAEHLHMHDEKRLGDAIKQPDGPGLSQNWYRTQADLFMQDYGQDMYETTGQSIDYNWEEQVVRNFCRHSKMTSGVEIDEAKLLNALDDLIKEREECVLQKEAAGSLASLAKRLHEAHDRETLNESPIMPVLAEATDPVQELLESNLPPSVFLERVEDMFAVRFSRVPNSLKKYRMGEGLTEQQVPMKARLPHMQGLRSIDERVLDLYIEHWNNRQAVTGEPIVLEWNPDPGETGVVGFAVMLK
jgi:hypothetical protein